MTLEAMFLAGVVAGICVTATWFKTMLRPPPPPPPTPPQLTP